MQRRRSPVRGLFVVVSLLSSALVLSACSSEIPMSTLDTQGTHAQRILDLLVPIFWAGIAVFVVVEGILIYSVFRFRSKPTDGIPVQIHGNTTIEVLWTIAPALILLVIAVLTFRTQAANAVQPPDALKIRAVGRQWWFAFEYPDLGVVTANEMYIPVGRDVQITLDGQDVIHNFWVPKLAGKTYMIPNNTNYLVFNATQEGIYRGQCAEFCGESHALMKFRVIAVQPEVFDQWVQQQLAPPAEPSDTPFTASGNAVDTMTWTPTIDPAPGGALGGNPAAGRQVFINKACWSCHVISGVGESQRGANNAPNLSYLGSRTTLAGGIMPNTPDLLAAWLYNPAAIKPGNLMSAVVKPGYLTDQEIKDLVAYLENQKVNIPLPAPR